MSLLHSNQISLKQNHVKYGLALVGVLIGCLLLMELTGSQTFDDKSPIFLLYQFVAPAVVWYLGLRAKKKQQGGKLTFKQGVKEGFKMSLVFGIVSPFVFLIYYFLNPSIVDWVKSAYQMPMASDTTVIALDMIVQFIAAIIFGTLYATIISFFVKSKS